ENGASLKQNMKQAGALFKAIGTSIKDPAKNPENAKSVEQMADFFQLTYAQIPDAVQKIPEAQRAQALAGYQKLIQDELELCKELHAAFLANNSDLATQIYQKMKDLKEEGHDKYNP
ncbi:MAG: hypothetical protein H7326_08285, partial [Bdellovibrionaceae bacterium]|nr:hypothetical protein [Pseudobdellovibrionaceae bacterium]